VPRYALLLKANANRVYGAAALDLARAEVGSFDRNVLGGIVESAQLESFGGVDYLVLEAAAELAGPSLEAVANLSSLHALFGVEGELLRPITIAPRTVMDEDVTTIQRYSGKTNEAFTHLLVNVALAESGAFQRLAAGERIALLDPACGRGTSLNRSVVYGMDAHGIEVDQRDVEAYTTFILTWLKDKRLKHQLEQAKLRKGRETPAHRITVTYGRGKDRTSHRVVDIIHDDTRGARTHLKSRTMDVLVCDLPYGVQHGSQPDAGRWDRGPAGLLRQALPVWADLLRPGGAMALAWNRHTLDRAELAGLVEGSGLELRTPADDDAFVHRVDRSILRDVLVAARPRS
jgi:hypothetical protein